MIDKLDVTSSGHGGVQALLSGILRGDGNIKGNLNSAHLPYADPIPFVRAGASGMFNLGIGSLTPFIVPALIIKVNTQAAVEGKMEYNFDVSLSVLAGSGVYIQAT